MSTSPTGKSQVLIAVTFLISAPYRVQADPRVLQVQVAQTETKYRERGASKQSLIPVPSPNLNGMEKIVQEQIRAAESKLTARLQKSGATTVDLSQAYGEMGKLYQAYDLKDAALACYLNAERLNPGNFAWQYYLGYLYQMKGDLEQSVVYFTNALKIQPHDQATLLRSAQTELDLNRRELAKILFQQALTLDSSCAAGMAGLGKIALSERRYADAVKHFNRALALQPHASGIEYQLALAYRGLADLTEAQTHLRKQGTNQPKFPDPLTDNLELLKKGKAALWMRGTQAINAGRIGEAIEDFRKMVTLDPKDPRALMYLGIALAQAGDRKEAVHQFSKALEIAPRHAGVHYNLGAVLLELGSEQEALEHFQAAISVNPQLTKAHFQLANLLMRKGRYHDAVPEYAAVIAMEPRDGFARLMEAMALVRIEDYSKARSLLEEGLLALPHDADLANALARLLAACPDPSVRNGLRALRIIQKTVSDQTSFDLEQGQTLAMAFAAVGQFQRAAQLQSTMIGRLEHDGRLDLTQSLRANLALYEERKPCLTPWRNDDPIFSPVPGRMGTTTEVSATGLVSEGSY